MAIVTLKKAIEEGKLKVGDRIAYEPKQKKCCIESSETGVDENQVIETENLKFQYVGVWGDNVFIASHYPTYNNYLCDLTLNYVELLKKVCDDLYSYPELDAKAMPITSEILKRFPKSWCPNCYLLGDSPKEGKYSYIYSEKICYESVYNRDNSNRIIRCAFLPVIELPADTLIDDVDSWIIEDCEGKNPKDAKFEDVKKLVENDVKGQESLIMGKIKAIRAEAEEEVRRYEKRLEELRRRMEEL